jgi:hypothetical protein
VVVTSDQPVVSVGRLHIGSQITTYDGFTLGSLNAYVPMLFKNMWGSYNAALYIQNVDDLNSADITLKFYDSAGTLTCSLPDSIEPLASKGYWLPSIPCLGPSWVGGVVITSDQPVVAVGRPHIGDEVTTYNGFTAGSTDMTVPMLFKNMWGSYNAALYVQNVDDLNPTDITLKFYDSNGTLTCSLPDTIEPLASKGYWLPSIACLGPSWVGGVVVASDQPVVSVGRPHIGSQITTYNGFVKILDEIPPAAIADLDAAQGALNGSVDLIWTAPGDDGIAGRASSYLVRYTARPRSSMKPIGPMPHQSQRASPLPR